MAAAGITEGGARSFAHEDKRIAVFRTPGGVFACDNRCPHQGYALVRGDVKDGVLTCAWHNWEFELGTGTCRIGGEAVRTYPAAVRDGQVWLDVADPSPEVIRPELFASLTAAMADLDVGRMARDPLRLQRTGTPLADVIAEGVRYAAPRAEYGWDHSLANCLRMSEFFEESLRALPVIQGLSVAAEGQVRRPDRARPDPVDPVSAYGSVAEALAAYPVLVDEERAADAEGLLRGLIAAQVPPAALRHALLSAVTDFHDHDRFPGKNRGQTVVIMEPGPAGGAGRRRWHPGQAGSGRAAEARAWAWASASATAAVRYGPGSGSAIAWDYREGPRA
jgi:nitrite reductase/ring-hydroxylating ferredoxin subunit